MLESACSYGKLDEIERICILLLYHDFPSVQIPDTDCLVTGLMRLNHYLNLRCPKVLHRHGSLIRIHDLANLFLAESTPTSVALVVRNVLHCIYNLDAPQLWEVRLFQLLKPGQDPESSVEDF
jgi:hypothetical protein